MKQHTLVQGSAEWHAHRATHFNASDAAAMLGCSPYQTRTQLLQAMHTGLRAEVDAPTQRRFDKGHEVEAAKRPLAESIIGEDLYPVVGSEGELSASFDGLTMLHDTNWECKSLNDELRAALPNTGAPDGNEADNLPKCYRVQMEQQCMVSGCARVLFTASDGKDDDRHCWYYPDPALRAEIVAGWAQFAIDLANYQHVAHVEPQVMGHAPESLPALRIEVTGMVTASNLDAFKSHALAVFGSINRTLTTDTEFADAEKTVKWCSDVEDRLKAAKQHALSQTESIDALFRTIDEISAEARTVRLDLDKLVTARKAAIKMEIVQEGKAAYEAHEAALRAECGCWVMLSPPDFAGSIKGLRTVESIRNAVQTTLANAKIKADESARTIRAALAALDEESKGFEHLFRDRLIFISMIPEAVRLMVRDRIAKQQQAEQDRAAELAEKERERIRHEEQAKAVEQAEREFHARRDVEPAKPTLPPAAAPAAAPTLVSQGQAANSPSVVPLRAAPSSPPSLKLGEINARLQHFATTEAGLAALGFPATKVKGACLYREADFPRMVDSMVGHLRMVAEQQLQAA